MNDGYFPNLVKYNLDGSISVDSLSGDGQGEINCYQVINGKEQTSKYEYEPQSFPVDEDGE